MAFGLIVQCQPGMARDLYSKTWDTGNRVFGAAASVAVTDLPEKSKYTISGKANADVRAVYREIALARATGSLSLDAGGNGRAQCWIKLAGSSLVNVDKFFSTAASFTTTPITKQYPVGSYRFSLAGFPVTIKAGASAKVYAKGSASLIPRPGTKPKLDARIAPVLDLGAYASGSLNAILAKLSLSADIAVLQQEAIAALTLTPAPVKPTVTYSFMIDREDAKGSVRGTIKVGVGFLSVKKRFTLWSYSGGHQSNLVASGTLGLQ